MKVYLFSYPEFFDGEAKVVSYLMAHYDFVFHLRKPNAGYKAYQEFMESIPEAFHQRIMLHGAYDLAQEYNVKGLHYSTINRSKKSNSIDKIQQSTSCHSIDEVKTIVDEYDYIFISPVFASISKEGYVGELNMLELQTYLKNNEASKLVALGGVNGDRIVELKGFGFQSCAILGAIWNSGNLQFETVLSNYQNFNQCLN